MYFNRYRISNIGTEKLVQFGLVDDRGVEIDQFSALVTNHLLGKTRKSLTEYIARNAVHLGEPPQSWSGGGMICKPETASTLEAAISDGQIAEIGLFNFALGMAILMARSGEKPLEVEVDAVALLRSEPSVHLNLLLELYGEKKL